MVQSVNATTTAQAYPTVEPEEFAKDLKSDNIYLIDVRDSESYTDGHIAGAKNLDVTSNDFLEKAEKELPRDKTIAVYCGLGIHSAMAADKLTAAGYKVLNLAGGIKAWKEAGLPVVK